MTSCYRDCSRKSKGNKVKKGTTATYNNNNQIAKYYFLNQFRFIIGMHHIFHLRSLQLTLTQSQGITYMHRIPQRHKNFLFLKLLGTRLLRFTFFVVIEVENSVT